MIIVADKGMSTGDNICYTLSVNDGYIFSQTARGANKELKNFIFHENDYEWLGDDYR
ncbi:MAG: hypothetical protein JW702_09445 [Clostridiales bacterium]|nr:hypothetical protein [Clostridiales bacterium]